MSMSGSGGPPAWLPASVGSAVRWGTADDEALLSGRAWGRLLESLGLAAAVLGTERAPATPVDQAAGYRHLMVLLALGIDEALRAADPYHPVIKPGNVDSVLKWGMDCPDAAYVGAAVRPDATYVVRGRRGTVRYLGFQVMGGIESLANIVAEDLVQSADGTFDIVLSAAEQPGNWMPLAAGASSLVVRQFFYDWENEEPAELSIECTSGPSGPERPPPGELSASAVARQLIALGDFVQASVEFWLDIEEAGRAQGLNSFREPAARTDIGGAAENVTVWGSWELDADQALVIEVTPPEARYWSVALGNYWWESIDFANHQSSLNGHQAAVDDDGVFRAVVSLRDPGVANWLDPAGNSRGPMIFRWVRADEAPVPATRVVPFDAVAAELPAGTPRVDPRSRRRAVAARRAGIERRYPR
ncbi:MAG: DUF1214 domain-containing protein [Acidimicrobiales bacterium]